ncbi:uncharacterized protein LOC122033333 [Zingiber officinale]|uniref:uncharacterized protein LOC122033333 n=1 Tax=Zingiber officinale TaxID=94328 RepID=UPI001C4BF7FD|nr:uncharacterized protein LOC122033333 [Zingiber officinale]
MLNSRKKFRTGGSGGGVSRLLAGLRPPEQGGSLVVQTGFPTSLADLVVKNRDRLKKPSRRKKPPPPPGYDSGESTAFASSSSTFASSSISAPPSNVSPRPGLNPPVLEADSCSPSPLAFSVSASRRIEFLLVVMVILMALAIERRKLVAAIVLSAFVLRLLDRNGFLLLWFSNPRSKAESTLNSSVKDCELEGRGVVSPIREITTDSSSETARSERSSVDLIQQKGVPLKRRDAEKVHLEPDPVPKANSKLKKFLRKFLSKKFRRRKCHEEREALVPDSTKNAILDKVTEIEEESNGDADPDIENEESTVSIVASDEVSDHDIRLFQEDVPETKSRNSQVLIFWAIVLLGLLGGKTTAIVLTVSWRLLLRPTEFVWKKGKNLIVLL